MLKQRGPRDRTGGVHDAEFRPGLTGFRIFDLKWSGGSREYRGFISLVFGLQPILFLDAKSASWDLFNVTLSSNPLSKSRQ